MSDTTPERRLRRFARIAVVLLLLLAAIVSTPFLLTAPMVNLALRQAIPANRASAGSASLSPSGELIVRDLMLHDTGAMAQQPLVTVREIDVTFGWRELLARKLRRIQANDVALFARSNGPSQLSLIDLAYELSRPATPAAPNRGATPWWIGVLEARGKIHQEAIIPFRSARSDLPLALRMSMSGERAAPSWQTRLVASEVRQTSERGFPQPSVSAKSPVINHDSAFGMVADVESRPTAEGTRLVIHRLAVTNAAIALDAGMVRRFVAALSPEVQGRIEVRLRDLSATGTIDLGQIESRDHVAGHLTFSGLGVRLAGDPKMTLSIDDLSGVADIDSNLPPTTGTAVKIRRLQANRTKVSVDADWLRRHAPMLPGDLHGPIAARLEALDVSGAIRPGTRNAVRFSGSFGLHDFSAGWPAGGQHAFVLDHLTALADLDSRIDHWEPATLKARQGTIRFSNFSYGDNAVSNLDGSWHADGGTVTFDRLAAQIFDGEISGAPQLDLATPALKRCDLLMNRIDAHKALAGLSPQHLDADGRASGMLHLWSSKTGGLSGYADISFDGPGVLKIGQIEELQRMLAGNFGAELAKLAMHDLEHYPFKEGSLHLESMGANSELKIDFSRQPRSATDTTPPHKEIINGKEVWVGSLVVPRIDLTIPISGKSFGEILSAVSGFHPLIEAAGKETGK